MVECIAVQADLLETDLYCIVVDIPHNTSRTNEVIVREERIK